MSGFEIREPLIQGVAAGLTAAGGLFVLVQGVPSLAESVVANDRQACIQTLPEAATATPDGMDFVCGRFSGDFLDIPPTVAQKLIASGLEQAKLVNYSFVPGKQQFIRDTVNDSQDARQGVLLVTGFLVFMGGAAFGSYVYSGYRNLAEARRHEPDETV